jgi:predicted extracellular nuclease
LPAEEQYSYVFDGNSQVLDQILVSKELLTPGPEYDSVHVNAEFSDQASDHDPQIARLVVRGPQFRAQLTRSPGRIDPANTAFANSRKPLAGEFRFRGHTVFVVANHFNSKGGDDPLFGHRQPPVAVTETQRHAQATIVNAFARDIQHADLLGNYVVLGDINDFEFSRTVQILQGFQLLDMFYLLPPNERYSYVFEGNSQALDHILVSPALLLPIPEYDSVHVNAEFSDQASDHDPQIARVVVRGTGNANGQ